MDEQSWQAGRTYMRRKRLCLAVISTSQLLLGAICTLLWVGSFEICRKCNGGGDEYCLWVFPMQGIWGGCFNFFCGVMGVCHSCSITRYMNGNLIFVSVTTMLASLGMMTIEIGIVTRLLFNESATNFNNTCLKDLNEGENIWNWFHYTVIFIGLVGTLQGLSACIMTSYAQCGCCGTYSSESRRTNTEPVNGQDFPHASHERLLPTYGALVCRHICVQHSCNEATGCCHGASSRRQDHPTEPEQNEQPTVDDLIQLNTEQENATAEHSTNVLGGGSQSTVENQHDENLERQSASQNEPPPPYSVS